MTSNIEFTYNGKVYQKVTELAYDSCEGCDFEHDSNGCDSALRKINCSGSVWKEKKGDNTVESTLQVKPNDAAAKQLTEMNWNEQEIREVFLNGNWWGWSTFIDQLKTVKDQEFKKYLELKAKFGD